MAKEIRINVQKKTFTGVLNESQSAELFYNTLPAKIGMSRWGDEYYGNCGISVSAENEARAEMDIGELAIWPDGSALCIFFGPTPASIDEKPRAISPVNPIGKIVEDVSFLKNLGGTIEVDIEKA
jgi:hypothetical protein